MLNSINLGHVSRRMSVCERDGVRCVEGLEGCEEG